MPRGLDDAKQQAFIDQYETLLNTMASTSRRLRRCGSSDPSGEAGRLRARKDVAVAVEQRRAVTGSYPRRHQSGTGQTQILAVDKVNALSFIKLLGEIEGTHTAMRLIHVFVDNASYHKADVVKNASAAGRKIVLPSFRPTVRISIPSTVS